MRRKPSLDPARAVAYVRVSTSEQALGPEAQREQIDRWAGANGISVIDCFEDLGVSGGAPLEARPGLTAAVAALAEHRAGVLVVSKRDRLARDVMTAAIVTRLVERAGARIMTADGAGNGVGPEATLMQTMIDAFAEYERALIRARTKAALAVKRTRGECVGQVPLGKTRDASPVLVENLRESVAIARAYELRDAGVSIRRIASALDAEGYAPRGGRWHARTVQRLLDRREFVGAR